MLDFEVVELGIDQLIEAIQERRTGYKKASEKMPDPYLKELFKGNSLQSDGMWKELLKSTHIHTDESNNFSALHRSWKFWIEMKTALKESERNSLLSACIKGEERVLEVYAQSLKDSGTPEELKDTLKSHYKAIQKTRDLLQIFKISL